MTERAGTSRVASAWFAALVAFSALGNPLVGQTVRGRVFRSDGRTPAEGVVITAIGDGGRSFASALSHPTGAYLLRMPPGTYQLRALKIGFRPTVINDVAIGADSVHSQDITLVELPVTIDRVVVRDKNECGLGGREGEMFLQLWEQARAALTATRLSEQAGTLDMHVVTIAGHVDAMAYYSNPRAGPLVRAPYPDADTAGAREFVSNSVAASTPPETLMTRGYIRRRSDGSFVFDMPPPEALISDGFASSYCFRVAQSPRERRAWVGIEFTPRTMRDSIIDIRGILWLERSTAELRRLEFEYTNLPEGEVILCDPDPDPRLTARPAGPAHCHTFSRALPRLGLGGDADFVRLDDGSWLISAFTVRMPPDAFKWRMSGNSTRRLASGDLERCTQGPGCMPVWIAWPRLVTTTANVVTVKLAGSELYRNDRVLAVIAAADAKRASDNPAQVFGVVTNVDGRPLMNAIVQVEDPGRVSTTDSAGAFAVRTLPVGQIMVTVRCRGYQPVRLPLTLQPGASRELKLSLSSASPERAPRDCSTGS